MRATSERLVGDAVALEREQDDDREQQAVEGDRTDAGQEALLVPLGALGAFAEGAGEEPGEERDAEEDEHRLGDLPDRDVDAVAVEAEPAGEQLEVEVAEQRVGRDLEHRVDRDQHSGELAVAARQVVPDQHHRDAAGQPDDDQPGAVLREVGEHQPGQREHHRRADQPVEDQRHRERAAVGQTRADRPVLHLGEHRVHHRQQPDRDRQRHGVDLDPRRAGRRGPGSPARARCRAASRRRSTTAAGDPASRDVASALGPFGISETPVEVVAINGTLAVFIVYRRMAIIGLCTLGDTTIQTYRRLTMSDLRTADESKDERHNRAVTELDSTQAGPGRGRCCRVVGDADEQLRPHLAQN